MAEFKLGRIRFVWKDNWSSSTTYYKDDVVQYGGRTYVCVIGHSSSADFFSDYDITPPKWNLVSDGTRWRGEWSTGIEYIPNDIVQYGARLYICLNQHNSVSDSTLGLEQDTANWQIYAEGLDFKGDWTTSTRYIVNDVVKYGGQTYVCNTHHTSASTASQGLENDQAKWDYLNQGVEFIGDWVGNYRYKVNDIVRYGAALWICTGAHTSNNNNFGSDAANWEQFVKGFQFESDWDVQKVYQPGDIVRYGGNQYISLTNHSNKNPLTSSANWQLFTEGFRFLGEWAEDSSNQDYRVGEIVRHGAYTYICIADHQNQEPPNVNYWNRLNSGIKWRGEWLDDQQYLLGDVVRYGDNSYICVLGHISEGDDFSTVTPTDPGGGNLNSRPDLDVTGVYWNIIAVGNEQSVLTTKGDLVYYSGAAPQRLPVGAEGQTLRVSSDMLPEWAYLGVSDDVYYVATHGTNLPAPTHGRTIDKPWASIRYACEQVEKGTKNPNARRLLELNRAFIQKEIVNWTNYQITNNISPFTSAFTYDTLKCERDMGLIVDALIWDITHGGNVKTREAALKYVNEPGSFYTLEQEGETVASINYGLTVIGKVLAQQAPDSNYQALNGDNSTAVVAQFFDSAITAETGVTTEISSLTGIITAAITAGNDNNIPARLIRTTLIRVATGTYYETLPMIVPAECCVMGDELRATNVQPRKASNSTLTPRSDVPFSVAGVDRLIATIDDIVLGNTVTPTAGNSETQSQVFPYGENEQANAAKQLMRVIKRNLDFAVGDKTERTLNRLDEIHDINYGYARNLLLANKEFIKAEVTGFLTANYPSLKYSKTKCKQDIGFIIDAVVYDLSYEGNWQSVTAGLAYYAGVSGALQINSSEKAATIQAYIFMRSLMKTVAQNVLVSPTQQNAIAQVRGTAGSASAATTIDTLVTGIIDTVNLGTGSSPVITYPDISGVAAGLTSASSTLSAAYATLKSEMTAFISYNFPNLTYDSAKCERDLGYILDAARYDWMLGTNFAGIVTAYSYLRTASNKVTGEQKTATLAAYEFARTRARLNVGGNATAQTYIDNTFEIVNDIIFGGSSEGGNDQIDEFNNYSAIRQIELNRDFLVAEVHAHVTEYFKSDVTNTAGSTEILTVSDVSWMRQNMAVKFVSPEDSTNTVEDAGLVEGQVYYIKEIIDATSITISGTIGGSAFNFEDYEFNYEIVKGYDYSIAACSRDVNEYLDAVKWDLTYPADWKRQYRNTATSTNYFQYFPAMYKSKLAARYYANSVIGSQEEDMYYLRNGTGLRLQTLDGLQGDLGPANTYGTSRPTAGAYASLDPGWGPDDQRVWITARSPYVQNLTTFGFAATGQRIDGALHNGGNDSIVSNDFTQVISDGIGAHILNNGRAELVSVFTYYSHIGYLAETGGRIRATNGNNSYGTFGSVAEGFDSEETAVTALVDNKNQYEATISQVYTDQSQEILAMEYSHAGNDYTRSQINVFGPGASEELVTDEFRDDGVFQVRLLDLDDSSGEIGGSGFLVTTNTAQSGTTGGQITLSATDSASSTAYIGMKLFITAGNGAGQYGIVNAYDSGTKVCQVERASDGVNGWDSVVYGTTIVAPDSTSVYQVEPSVQFTAPTKSSAAATMPATQNWNTTHYYETSAIYSAVTGTTGGHTGTDASFDVERVGSKYYVTLNDGGTDYTRLETIVIDGSNLGGVTSTNNLTITISAVNAVTGAVTDFAIEGVGLSGQFIALGDDTGAGTSTTGTSWSTKVFPTSGGGGATWNNIASGFLTDGSSTFETTAIAAVCNGSNNVAYSVDGATFSTASLPGGISSAGAKDIAFKNVGIGVDRFVVISDDDQDIAYSDDGGATWTIVSTALPSTGFSHIVAGQGHYVAIKGTTAAATDAVYSTDGITWTSATGGIATGRTVTDMAFGSNMFIATCSDTDVALLSIDHGDNWGEITLPTIGAGSAFQSIAYGQGIFVAVPDVGGSGTADDTVVYSQNGRYWQNYTATIGGGNLAGFGSIAFGNPQRVGQFVAVTNASATKATQIKIGATTIGRPSIASEKIFEIRLLEPGSGYSSAPTMTVVDPNNLYDINVTVRTGKGAMANPSYKNRGIGFIQATANIDSANNNGRADFFQNGQFVAVKYMTERPVAGSNVVFAGDDTVYKLVSTITFLGDTDGTYTAFLQLSPEMSVTLAPADEIAVTMRIRYSQVRLTGHDFLDIGTGNFADTNYPGTPVNDPVQANETVESNGGRVFYTATDQDGNFRVGDLFSVEQATGVATLNADAFNIAGLQELTLGEVTLGGNSASVTEFSTDPFFTANSDTVVPTQRAVKAYIEAQIGGGGASLNVNSVTAGDISISSNIITNVTGGVININAKMNFTGGVVGLPIAYNYFLR